MNEATPIGVMEEEEPSDDETLTGMCLFALLLDEEGPLELVAWRAAGLVGWMVRVFDGMGVFLGLVLV